MLAVSLSMAGPAVAQLASLGTAAGDGSVQFAVDAYGSYGYHAFGAGPGGQGDAIYDPVGAVGPSSTTWESAVYFRAPPMSRFMTTGLVGEGVRSGGLPSPGFLSVNGTVATSAFSYQGLDWQLTQTVQDLVVGPDRLGTLLVQEYVIRNPGPAPVAFDLVRYYEGDLFLGLGAGVPDGGGRLLVGSEEFVFETDQAGEPADSTNLVGITACGGVAPAVGRFEVNAWSAFPTRITADQPLADIVAGDGPDADQFVDAGGDYDVGIALANRFALAPGQVELYVTTTTFGSLPPDSVTGGCGLAENPVASAGPDVVTCPNQRVVLDGSGSFDADARDGGFAESWTWDLDVSLDSDGNTVPDDDVDTIGEIVAVSFPLGTTIVQLTYTDDDGTVATDTKQIVVEDLPPRIACPLEVVATATSFLGGPAALAATATDDCDALPDISNDRTAGGADASDDYPCGTTLVTFTATDAFGNRSTCRTVVRISPDGATFPVGAALRVSKLPDQQPMLDWSLVGAPAPEVRYTVLRDDTDHAPRAVAPRASGLAATSWLEPSSTGSLIFYDVRTSLCDGSLSDD
jgi:hypothetical protein